TTSGTIHVGGTTLGVTITGDPVTTPAPVSAAVNQFLTFDSQVTDPLVTAGTDPNGLVVTFSYSWSVTHDGQPFTLPSDTDVHSASLTFAPPADGVYVVSLVVTDGQGGVG